MAESILIKVLLLVVTAGKKWKIIKALEGKYRAFKP
jgi:hypothetical protein